jgi:hypothetical protein
LLWSIHRDFRFDKQLFLLQKAAKKATIAAQKAEEIIDKLLSGVKPEKAGTLTRYGERRIENCMKYDLGNGYRLVTCIRETQLYILYIGTHDECHRWLENNKGLQPASAENRGKHLPVDVTESEDPVTTAAETETEKIDDYLDHIDEKDLRVIFRGICGG